ncbi:MAG: hypothetical protein HC902_00050 [Calothrix sp. SM1_5_4]|nr:hypothetical protein [Calothrix sp. SM1_5_4]
MIQKIIATFIFGLSCHAYAHNSASETYDSEWEEIAIIYLEEELPETDASDIDPEALNPIEVAGIGFLELGTKRRCTGSARQRPLSCFFWKGLRLWA